MKNLLRAIAVAMIVVTFSVLCGCNYNIHNSPEAVVRAFFEASAKSDPAKILECCPDYEIRRLAQEAGLPQDTSRKSLANFFKMEGAHGYSNFELEGFAITLCELIDHMPAEDFPINREYYGMTGMEYREITEVAIVKVEYEYKDTYYDNEIRKEKWEVECVKIDNKWYLLSSYLGY